MAERCSQDVDDVERLTYLRSRLAELMDDLTAARKAVGEAETAWASVLLDVLSLEAALDRQGRLVE